MDMQQIEKYGKLISDYTEKNYRECFREPSGQIKYKFIVPGSCYSDDLWDWDSWLTDLALGEFIKDDISEYEKGCVLNFLDFVEEDGTTPIWITPRDTSKEFVGGRKTNIHKPCLAQHALYISEKYGFDWLREKFDAFERYIGYYENNCKHESGLYFWLDDFAIGVDNDPCTFYRPENSSGSIYLNCFMYKELLATSKIASALSLADKAEK